MGFTSKNWSNPRPRSYETHISLGVFDMNGGRYSYPMMNTVELHGTSFQ